MLVRFALLAALSVAATAAAQTTLPLPAGTVLTRGTTYTSATGRHTLTFQPDGNLVVRPAAGGFTWGLNTVTPQYAQAARVEMATDGRLTVTNASGGVIWRVPAEAPDPASSLHLTPGGMLEVVSPTRGVLWSTNPYHSIAITPGMGRRANVDACRAGLALLRANAYAYPAAATAWTNALRSYRQTYGASCDGIGAFLTAYAGEAVAAPAAAAISSSGAARWADYVTGTNGYLTVGDQIAATCPAGNGASFDCAAAANRVATAMTRATAVLDLLDRRACTPNAGWAACRQLTAPTLRIMTTAGVTRRAVDAVEAIYTDMVSRFKPAYNPAVLDNYIIYLTAAEPWAELSGLSPVGTMMGTDPDGTPRGDFLRGGSGGQYLWITEQMICKEGVQTRNEAYARGQLASPDYENRAYDQVVHEFGHTIHQLYGLNSRVQAAYAGYSRPDLAFEYYAWATQAWFGTPGRTLTAEDATFMNEAFDSQSAYSCAAYAGSALAVAAEADEPATAGALLPAWPNPVASRATIPFDLARPGHVTLAVHDALGRQVAVLADRPFGAGPGAVTWDASGVASGVYVVSLRTEDGVQTRRLVVAR